MDISVPLRSPNLFHWGTPERMHSFPWSQSQGVAGDGGRWIPVVRVGGGDMGSEEG